MQKPSKALVAKWYRKLAKSGFEDIENTSFEMDEIAYLNKWHSTYFVAMKREKGLRSMIDQREYFSRCYQFLHVHPFESAMDRKIWTKYADGVKPATIARELKTGRHKVQLRLRALESLMNEWVRNEQSF